MSYHPSPSRYTGVVPRVVGAWKVQLCAQCWPFLFVVVSPLLNKLFSLTDHSIADSDPPPAGVDMDSSFTWIPLVFEFSSLSPCCSEPNEGEGACYSGSQPLIKAIRACGTWEGCLPGDGLSFRTPQFLTEQKMIFLNVSNYICGGVGGEVHRWTHTPVVVFQGWYRMPQEGLCRNVCFESWRIQYCPRLTYSWEKSKPGASPGIWALHEYPTQPLTFSCKHFHPGCVRHQGQLSTRKSVLKGYYDSGRRYCGLQDNDNNCHLKS